MRPHTLRENFLSSTATAALLVTLSAPAAFAQATPANITTTLPGVETISTSATYTAGSTQQLSATPSASTLNNNVNINLTTAIAGNDTVTTAINAANNLISASATGNISAATAALAFAPSTAGDTAAVGTLQSVEANVTASSTGDTHSVIVDNSVAGPVRTFTGSALQNNNDITASATGNNGTSSITVAAGLDVIQAAAAQASVTIASGVATVNADLAVSSSQKIDPAGSLVVSSLVSGATTTTGIESLNGATVTISNSDQASSTTGNTATNSITSLDTTASITGSTAVANQQSIGVGASVTATTMDSSISAFSGRDSNLAVDGLVTNSTVSLTQNTQTAAATGSASTQTLTLNASSITGEGGVASIFDFPGGLTGGAQISATADAVIANDQSIIDGVPVTATTTNNSITSAVISTSTTTTSTLEVAGNTQSASATGVSTSNALSLTSGATMSATGAVASVQSVDGNVSAVTTLNDISNTQGTNVDLIDSSMLTTGNTMSASATGANASNTLSTTATNNLSFATNAGSVLNGISGGDEQPSVFAGMALTNDQAQRGTVAATATGNQVLTSVGTDAVTSTVTTDTNTLSASATGNQAGNAINLAFNALAGTISTDTGVVAGLANDQTLSGGVTARNVGSGGIPVLTQFGSDAQFSTVSTSGNVVSATARGNVTTGNAVVVDATNITSASQAAPSTVIATGAVSATGSFIAASTQISDATILASQLNVAGAVSNTIETQFGDDIQQQSTVVSDNNLLSASGTANSANNAVQLGTAATAAIAASGVVANYQGTATLNTVSAEIGTLGTDPAASFVSTNTGSSTVGTLSVVGSNIINGTALPVTLTFGTPLTAQEVSLLLNAGYTSATIGGTTAFLAGSATADLSIFSIVFSDPFGPNNESFTISGFNTLATPGTLNGAGVIIRLDMGGNNGQILDSTVSVSGNTVVGEVNGNIATNAASATATAVTGLSAAATSITIDGATVAPTNSDLATTNVQNSASVLASDVAATFAIIADTGNIQEVINSTQTVSNNLQQSFATANRATSSVVLTATNTDADTALQSAQASEAAVATTSDLDVVANAGGTTSSLAMDGNRNQSVANGNIVANTITLDVTNATATVPILGPVDASGTGAGPVIVTANNALFSSQSVTGDVTATATTDVYNQDVSRPTGNEIISSDVSFSNNATIAQATGNSGAAGNTLTLGNAGTANMERTGILLNSQSVTATNVSATVDQDVSVSLTNTLTVPLQASSLSLDGNSSTALARSNVITNTLNVDGANINAGAGTDASFAEFTNTLTAAYVLGSFQDNTAGVTATTKQSAVDLSMTNAEGNAIDSSTVSLSGNASSATALANTAINNVSVGANAANVDATAALGNTQANTGAVLATGGSSVSVTATAGGITSPVGINGTSVVLSGNASASNAVGNQAQNLLTASGTNITSGATGVSAGVSSLTSGALTASAGNLLLSNQDNSGTITSTNTANSVTINGSAATGTGAAASGSTLSVTGNTTEARATANLVLNSSINLGGASTSSADATGMIANFQFNSAAGEVAAAASTSTTVSLNGAGTTGALNAGSATVQGNSTLALARGNVVENSLVAEGTNVSAGVSPATIVSGLSTDTGVLNASFGVFNEQVQQATVNATSTNARYAINATSGTGNALNAASALVDGNSVNASAFGNVATNSVRLVSLNGGTSNDASAAVFNGQINSGAITALATGAMIGTYSTGGVVSASVGVTGNTISATAVGNFATSTVTRATR